ncbi:hypothetical protein NPIL_379501 [Nephila pilipes]|uniref:Uncharacterized protein n=1 Tax=Nephila pilipes TaxID=299642 RepID=A0A8X6T8Z6_NEPPI|nr:hypothetical protein NPIL_379501 [Nephila pilipes]
MLLWSSRSMVAKPQPAKHYKIATKINIIKFRFYPTKKKKKNEPTFAKVTPYAGPYLVRSRTDKNYIIDLNGKQNIVSIDRVKPTYPLTEDTNTNNSESQPSIKQSPTVPSNPVKQNTLDTAVRSNSLKHLNIPSSDFFD